MKNNIQNAIDQLGIETVSKSLGHTALGNCDLHGMYAIVGEPTCPLCPNANGTTASEVEHFLDIKQAFDPTSGHNPGQVANPTAISERDIERGYEDKDGNRLG